MQMIVETRSSLDNSIKDTIAQIVQYFNLNVACCNCIYDIPYAMYTETCDEDEFLCPNDAYPHCIPHSYLCDSYDDCSDGYDELNCSTSEETHFAYYRGMSCC